MYVALSILQSLPFFTIFLLSHALTYLDRLPGSLRNPLPHYLAGFICGKATTSSFHAARRHQRAGSSALMNSSCCFFYLVCNFSTVQISIVIIIS